jgi:hypothetical protein
MSNDCWPSGYNILAFCLLSENVQIKIRNFVLFGFCETVGLALLEKYSEEWCLRKGPKREEIIGGERKLRQEELRNL